MSFVMSILQLAFSWFAQSAVVCSALLFVGYLAAAVCRQPIDRLRILQWTLAITLLSIIATALTQGWKLIIPSTAVANYDMLLHQNNSSRADHDVSTYDQQHLAVGALSPNYPAVHSAQNQISQENVLSNTPPPTTPFATVRLRCSPIVTLSISTLYLAGVMMCLFRWCIAYGRLRQIYCDSFEAPKEIHNQLARLTKEATNRVELRISANVATPVTWGLWSPVIMLPQSAITEHNSSPLRYYLMHEWSHVKRCDSLTWQMAVCLHCFLYYNPLYWHVRRALRVAMDQLADAEAANQGETPVDYAEFLLQLARYREQAFTQLILGVSDKHSQLRQRVEYLLSSEGRTRMVCPPVRSMAIAAFAIAFGVASTAFRFEALAATDERSTDGQQQIEEQPSSAAEEVPKSESPPRRYPIPGPSRPGDQIPLMLSTLDFSTDGTHFAIGGNKGLWVYRSGYLSDELAQRVDTLAFVRDVRFSPNGPNDFVTWSDDQFLRRWEVGNSEPVWQLHLDLSVRDVRFSPDGGMLFVSEADFSKGVDTVSRLVAIDAHTGKEHKEREVRIDGHIRCIDVSADGRWLAMGTDGKMSFIVMYDLEHKAVTESVELQDGFANFLLYNRHSDGIIVGGGKFFGTGKQPERDGRLWWRGGPTQDQGMTLLCRGGEESFHAGAISPDGKTVAVLRPERRPHLSAKGREIGNFLVMVIELRDAKTAVVKWSVDARGHDGQVAFTPDGSRLAYVGGDTISIFAASDGELDRKFVPGEK